jgi:hypothetical protein
LTRVVSNDPDMMHLLPALESDLAKDPDLRLKMLRAESYDCERAAVRLANYLNLLLETFGPNMLSRPIQLADLTPEEHHLKRQGTHQLFKFRDNSGRRIAGCFDVESPSTASAASQVSVRESIERLLCVASGVPLHLSFMLN